MGKAARYNYRVFEFGTTARMEEFLVDWGNGGWRIVSTHITTKDSFVVILERLRGEEQ